MLKCEGLLPAIASFLVGLVIAILFATGHILIGTVTIWILLLLAAIIFILMFLATLSEDRCVCRAGITVISSAIIVIIAAAWLLSYPIVALATGAVILVFIIAAFLTSVVIGLVQFLRCKLHYRCRRNDECN